MPLKCRRRRSRTSLDRVDTVVSGVQRTPSPSRFSCVWNTETVRHEALHDRAEVRGLRRRVVAAARLELREA